MTPVSYLPGMDVSHWQGRVNWNRVPESGIQFAYIKATDGVTFTDPYYLINCTGCKDAGILRGSYHFFRPSDAVNAQLDAFGQELEISGLGDLPMALDLEVGPMDETELDHVYEFLTGLKEKYSVVPVLYVDMQVAGIIEVEGGLELQEVPLWLANYSGVDPSISGEWAFWQHTPQGQVVGVPNQVDLDWFNGSLEQLRALKGNLFPQKVK
jgi:lysozyme